MPIPAKVVAIVDRSGAKGVTRIRAKIVENERHKDKIIVRNVMGPIKMGDIIMLQEADVEMDSIGD